MLTYIQHTIQLNDKLRKEDDKIIKSEWKTYQLGVNIKIFLIDNKFHKQHGTKITSWEMNKGNAIIELYHSKDTQKFNSQLHFESSSTHLPHYEDE